MTYAENERPLTIFPTGGIDVKLFIGRLKCVQTAENSENTSYFPKNPNWNKSFNCVCHIITRISIILVEFFGGNFSDDSF